MSDPIRTLSTEQLHARLTELHSAMKAAKAEKRAIAAELDRRAAVERVQQMTDAEKRALAQAIGDAGGIVSAEAVGEPGR